MVNDAHIHVGQFYDSYTSPQDLSALMKELGVMHYAVSSTTTCEENYDKVISEIHDLISLDGNRVLPVMWITESLINNTVQLNRYLESGIKWKCIKIHPDLEPRIWLKKNKSVKRLLSLAKELSLPIMIHTGGNCYSQASCWTDLINNNPDQIFILAHCRPFNDAITLIKNYSNVYGDLAFVSSSDFNDISKNNVSEKLLWGSDVPITNYYMSMQIPNYYKIALRGLETSVSKSEFENITINNFNQLFNL